MNLIDAQLSHLLRNPPVPCPVKNFELRLDYKQAEEADPGRYFIVISRKQYNADYYTVHQRLALANWLNGSLLPQMNQIAPVYLEVIE